MASLLHDAFARVVQQAMTRKGIGCVEKKTNRLDRKTQAAFFHTGFNTLA